MIHMYAYEISPDSKANNISDTYVANQVYKRIVTRVRHGQPMCTKPKDVDVFVAR